MPSENTEQRKLAAIMFTDMVGYSALSQRNEKLAQELLEEHRALLRPLFARFNGTEIKTIGDAFLVEFHSALEAAQCGIEIQRALAKRNHDVPNDRRVEIKIGIHIGDVVHRGGDVYGDGVNIASRIEPLAGAGGICVSMDVERQIRNALEARFEKLAPTELKNISVAMDLFRIVLPWESQSSSGRESAHSKHGTRNAERGGESQSRLTSAATKWIWAAALFVLAVGLGWWFVHQSGQATKQATSSPSATTAPTPTPISQIPSPAVPPPADAKSIAVLAFANLSEDKGNEIFSEGISEELLNVLAKIPGLKVTARTSAFYFKGKEVPIPEIAQKLGVAYVVEGSVRKQGDKVRITAQLIKAADGFHVWSDTFTRELKDIFAVQDEIAGIIAKNLQLTLGGSSRVAHAVNPEAHALVLEGRYFWAQRNDVAFERAEAAFQRALVLDPEFAEAHAGLADVWAVRGWYRIMVGNAVQAAADFTRAKEEVRRAQTLNPALAEPYATLGVVLMNEWKFDEAERQFAQAVALNPNYAVARHWHSALLEAVGRLDESLKEIERAIILDPLAPNFLWQKAISFWNAGSGRVALDATERALALRPGHPTILSIQALALWHLGRRDEAIAAARAVGRDLTAQPRWVADPNSIYVLRQAGLQAEAEAYAARALANVPKDDYRYGTTLVALGRGKEALTYLQTLPPSALANVYWHPMWDSLREDAQFQQWLVKLGCAAEYQVARETLPRMLKEREAKK